MQKLMVFFLFLAFTGIKNDRPESHLQDTIPAGLKGKFTDDYGIKYLIADSVWIQYPHTRFHIIKWNVKERYLVARNDDANPGEGGLYTRIDFMTFSNMEPWRWGYCLSVYDAKTDQIAETTAKADRQNPMKGCGGYPFSRMKRVE